MRWRRKELLKALPSPAIMWCIYVPALIIFLPAIHPSSLLRLDAKQVALLAYASISTLIAYGCFAEALDHWEASRVSAVLAITPLLTIFFVSCLAQGCAEARCRPSRSTCSASSARASSSSARG